MYESGIYSKIKSNQISENVSLQEVAKELHFFIYDTEDYSKSSLLKQHCI